ncbi:hypothetical protein AVO45_11620 [Ruegeria marisrubri]|uniref:Uncharacterized protein n=1 Tax=Ruegeria marisrubri TaxID=1685379 RepID=A0A0X3TL98_9RHOB|nr:DUF6478 family protein [Ruegeria marisrubri]KUJ76439.1 hypothetical protein AVO45_11620 [Ruegeria marisrubri]
MNGLSDRLLHALALRKWRRAACRAETETLAELRMQRNRARVLRGHLDRLIHVADGRLSRPRMGSANFPRPLGTDWSWRPDLWRGPLPGAGLASAPNKAPVDDEVTLFHDCDKRDISLRQTRNTRDDDLAPFAVCMDVFGFDGSFLSLSVDLPREAGSGLTKSHLMRLDTSIETERPLGISARLNIQHGPNTEHIVRDLPADSEARSVEFDLAYARVNEKRIEKIWLDLIFDAPEMNRMVVRDLTLCRHYRADF